MPEQLKLPLGGRRREVTPGDHLAELQQLALDAGLCPCCCEEPRVCMARWTKKLKEARREA